MLKHQTSDASALGPAMMSCKKTRNLQRDRRLRLGLHAGNMFQEFCRRPLKTKGLVVFAPQPIGDSVSFVDVPTNRVGFSTHGRLAQVSTRWLMHLQQLRFVWLS